MKMRKIWRLLALGLCVMLLAALLAGGVAAQSVGDYRVEAGKAAAGRYQLTTVESPSHVLAGGGNYRLLAPPAPRSAGSGCRSDPPVGHIPGDPSRRAIEERRAAERGLQDCAHSKSPFRQVSFRTFFRGKTSPRR